MPDPLIELHDIRLTLGRGAARTEILRGIDLRLDEGETLAILGPSGSGKSSLMAVISGLEQPTGDHEVKELAETTSVTTLAEEIAEKLGVSKNEAPPAG